MAEQTLLTMVQNILSSLDSDEVNSIGDTIESRQVANIVQNKYYDMVSRGFFPEHNQLIQLQPSLDPTAPVLMFVPATVSKLYWIKYFDSNVLDGASIQSDQFGSFAHDLNIDLKANPQWTTTSSTSNTVGLGTKTFTVASSTLVTSTGQGVAVNPTGSTSVTMSGTLVSYTGTTMVVNVTSTSGTGTFASWTLTGGGGFLSAPGYKYVTMIPTDQFLEQVNRFNPAEKDVASFNLAQGGNQFKFYYKTDHQPTYCTVISDKFVVFDQFDLTQDTTLQGNKTLCYGQLVPNFQLNDTFIPPLDDQQFPLLLNEAKSLAWVELKQTPHLKADQEIQRQWSAVQKTKSVSNRPTYFQQLPDFGRVPRTGGYSSGGYGAYKWMRQAGP